MNTKQSFRTKQESQALISVLIPAYNVEKYIKRCLDSVCTNTYKNLEIICIDDGSTDTTPSINDAYPDSRLKVVHLKHKGLFNARNTSLIVAKGQYITFIDSNDNVHSHYFECLLAAIQGG